MCPSYRPAFLFRDAEIIEELYMKHNKYFDKDLLIRDILYPLMGDSILQAASTEDWAKKRKSLAVAFYKDKMLKMIDLVKGCMEQSVLEWRHKYSSTGQPMDIIEEVSKVLVRIMLTCAFGKDLSERTLDYYEHGVKTTKTVAFVLREVFHKCIDRLTSVQVNLFPNTALWCITPWDRENQRNTYILRDLLSELVKKRREQYNQGKLVDKGDLLAILLNDELFHNNDTIIVDECLTFFFAGSQTSSIGTQNMIIYLMQQPNLLNRLRAELDKEIIQPYINNHRDESEVKLWKALDYDSIFNL